MILNPLSWFITTREKVLALIALFMIAWGLGWYAHTVWTGYLDTTHLRNQLARANAAPAKISKFHQELRKTNVQNTECWNTNIPDDVLKLLYQ